MILFTALQWWYKNTQENCTYVYMNYGLASLINKYFFPYRNGRCNVPCDDIVGYTYMLEMFLYNILSIKIQPSSYNSIQIKRKYYMTYTHLHLPTHTYTHTHLHTHTHTYTHLHSPTLTYTYTYVHLHSPTHTYTHTPTHTHTYTRTHTYTHTPSHTYTHTHPSHAHNKHNHYTVPCSYTSSSVRLRDDVFICCCNENVFISIYVTMMQPSETQDASQWSRTLAKRDRGTIFPASQTFSTYFSCSHKSLVYNNASLNFQTEA